MPKIDPLADILGPTAEPSYTLGRPVPNRFPSVTMPYRIAIVGEAPGRDEELQGQPFVGQSGRLLNGLLSKANIAREACFIGNVCQYRPPNNDISQFSRTGDEITEGLNQLAIDLEQFKPNIVLLLGKTALWAAKDVDNITDWRGSLFISDKQGPFFGRKCIAAIHPAACLRQYDWTPLLMFDINKCRADAESPTLDLPIRNLRTTWASADELVDELNHINEAKCKISVDIEGYVNAVSCISIAPSATYSFIVPFTNMDGSSYWQDVDDELKVWKAFSRLMSNHECPKIFQNGLYDRFVLQYGLNIVVLGNCDDTMLKWWELYCELEKSLAVQCSILGKEPYYKFERKKNDRETFYRYCCKDSALTYENNEVLERLLPATAKKHYRFNMDLLNVILYMELRGIKYNTKLAKQKLKEVNENVYNLQHELDAIANVGVPFSNNTNLLDTIRSIMCYKRDCTKPKKEFEEDYYWAEALLAQKHELTKAEKGRLNIACNLSMNIRSPVFKKLLYETLKLPKQLKRDPTTGIERLSVDYESLLKIQKKQPHEAVRLAIDIGELRTRSQMLSIHADPDGRIRCGYNLVGTETGRLTSYTSPTGSGYNLQTIPSDSPLKPISHPLKKGMRDLFVADDGYYMAQCDLSGADGWTVGAHLAALGDPTMLDDLRNKIKPAAAVCYLLRHGKYALNGKTRPEIKDLLKEVNKEDWDYFASKQGIWGTCYTMGHIKLANVILIQSEGTVNMSAAETKTFQDAVFTRYNVHLWHRHVQRLIDKSPIPTILSPSGHTRRFLGRKTELLGEMLAHEPQTVTTYATNLAAWKLWTDPDNRVVEERDGIRYTKFKIEPLHTIHDAIVCQFKIEHTTWAVDKIKSYFANEVLIAGIPITIPFEGNYGLNWALDKESKKGDI